MSHRSANLENWADRLGTSGLPIFSATVRAVSGAVARRETSAQDLARAIGQDASLSVRLLKIANSPLFNLQNRTIETISAAVVLLGFDAVRELAVSLALIEQVLKGRSHARVTQCMTRAFHAAAQARAFAILRGDKCPEEVFVAALLLNIGEMAFWSVADTEAAAIERLVRAGASLDDAARQVLGFSLDALTGQLVEQWNLGGLLAAAVGGDEEVPRTGSVLLGHEVARCVEQFGWSSGETRALLVRVAEELQIKPGQVNDLVKGNVEEATKIAARYGVPRLERILPAEVESSEIEVCVASAGDAAVSGAAHRQPDPGAQLKSLQEIAAHLEGAPQLDELVRLVLEGLHDGVGFDTCYFALLSPDRAELSVKLSFGRPAAPGLRVTESTGGKNLFSVVLSSGKALHVTDAIRRSLEPVFTDAIRGWVAESQFVVMPVVVAGKAVGVLYADNEPGGAPIEEDAFSGFRHFGQQIALGLGRIGG